MDSEEGGSDGGGGDVGESAGRMGGKGDGGGGRDKEGRMMESVLFTVNHNQGSKKWKSSALNQSSNHRQRVHGIHGI